MNEYIMMFKFPNIYVKAFLISLVYVALGTYPVCSVYPDAPFFGSWSLIALFLTFPMTVISFGNRFGDAHTLYPVYIIQFVMFLIMFGSVGAFYKSRGKKKDERQKTPQQ